MLGGRRLVEMCDSCDLERAFGRFYELRKANADAIASMAVENYFEMRDHVARADYQWHKKIENALAERFPDRFLSRYAMVSFTTLPYAEALARGAIQAAIIRSLAAAPDLSQLDWASAESQIIQR